MHFLHLLFSQSLFDVVEADDQASRFARGSTTQFVLSVVVADVLAAA
jgi:hypothetical protein